MSLTRPVIAETRKAVVGGVAGRACFRAWRLPGPRSAAVVFRHGFGGHSGLCCRLDNALAASGIELCAVDEIGHGLTKGERTLSAAPAELRK